MDWINEIAKTVSYKTLVFKSITTKASMSRTQLRYGRFSRKDNQTGIAIPPVDLCC